MKKKLQRVIGIVTFFIIVICIINYYLYVIKPKPLGELIFPTAATYNGFYEIEKYSIDVVFLGSSHATCAFNPAVMDRYGISSYNLSCPQQNLYTSYYWLKECIRYQKPKAVYLDIYMLYLFDNEELKPNTFALTLQAFDFMKMSPNKIRACLHGKDIDPKLTFMTMLFPNLVYKQRWKELSEGDFRTVFTDDESFTRGYYALYWEGVEGYTPHEYYEIDEDNVIEPNPLMLSYLIEIIKLCEKENIPLILVSTPTTLEHAEEFNYLVTISDRICYDVELIDFNSSEVYYACGYDFKLDNSDDDHANIRGSEKITSYLAEHYLNTIQDKKQ